ncbi:MAG: Lrp/AsnC family transcriptional regulator [Burkholderiales bacterium]|nr:Lrp/AsnC family transcriptional regulator [Burkholderiales bacterium]MDE1929239.1 Lrp/AsnC family transcriptional regulator [Burkholderiales bacterium]MDE2158855.1 Lrp/AsnC family transcriptional regulator [Burkholderiales bacterium]MDE2502408.1 Lrp/AsnC family transcriptional regulator [Burkholderiales bacterium]
MSTAPDALDQQLIALLKVNARLPVVRLAQALGCARSTVQLRLKALEDSGAITGYTVSVARAKPSAQIRAIVLIAIDPRQEPEIIKALTRRHEIDKIYTVSGRYDLCAMLSTESTQDLDAAIDRMRAVKGVNETVSTILLSTKLDRPL